MLLFNIIVRERRVVDATWKKWCMDACAVQCSALALWSHRGCSSTRLDHGPRQVVVIFCQLAWMLTCFLTPVSHKCCDFDCSNSPNLSMEKGKQTPRGNKSIVYVQSIQYVIPKIHGGAEQHVPYQQSYPEPADAVIESWES